jgi:hypothetical protein
VSYNLLAESPSGVDWEAVERRLKPELRWVEIFPIPGDTGSSDALGLSIPAKAAEEESFREICRLARLLREDFGMRIVDLHTSSELTPATEELFRRSFLG